jgi:parallel beta-helix repeat protein
MLALKDIPPMPRNRRSSWRAALLLPIVAAALVSCVTKTAVEPGGVVAGAAPIGSTAYAVPGGAKFVSPSGNDGAAGTKAAPWRTLGKAVASSPSGSTIVMRGGTYNERVFVASDRRVTIQSYPGETVWMSGSTAVTGWVADGGDWRKDGWTVRFDRSNLPTPLVDPAFPMAAHPDQAWIDGARLQQVGSRGEVRPGTFFVDEGANRLWIGNNPANRSVEASVLAEGLEIQSGGSIVRGIGFKNYANPIRRLGSVKLTGNGIIFEQNHVSGAASSGVSVLGNDVRVLANTITDNGQIGIHVDGTSGLRVEGNILSSNNAERFITSSAAGGIKLTRASNVTVRDNVVEGNHGHGIWFDGFCSNATMVHNVTRYNASAGLFFEMSDQALIAGNVSTNNVAGIQAGESSNVQVWNNTLVDNVYAFKAYKGFRAPLPVGFLIRNNVVSAPASHLPLFDNDDVSGQMTWSDMRWDSDFNAFYRESSTETEFFEVLANGQGRLHYKSLNAIRDATTLETNSMAADNTGINPYVADIASGDYRLPPGSPARGRGAPLPTFVADALGVRAGVRVDMGAI